MSDLAQLNLPATLFDSTQLTEAIQGNSYTAAPAQRSRRTDRAGGRTATGHSRVAGAVLAMTVAATASVPADAFDFGEPFATDPVTTIDDTAVPTEYLDIGFDGRTLGWQTVADIAPDPVMDWGFVRGPDGEFLTDEVWMIVARGDHFVYYHLLGEPNDRPGATTYGGYTVRIKIVLEHSILNFGSGADVPWIGNDEEAFTYVQAQVFLNYRFAGVQQLVDLSTNEPLDSMVELGTLASWANVPYYSSAGHKVLEQHLSPIGQEINYDIQDYRPASAQSLTGAAVGDSAGSLVSAMSAAHGSRAPG